jgi:hypothetical protein
MAEDKQIGQLDPGGTVQLADKIPVERGATNVYVAVAPAGTKAVSDASKDTLASVDGATAAGHLAVFTDQSGTVGDGGEPGAVVTDATPLALVLTTDLLPVVRGGVIYLATVAAVLGAQPPSGTGGQYDFSDPVNSAYAAII